MKTARRLIAIDIDDTIADSTESLRLLVNKRVGVDLPQEAYRIKGDYWGYYERVWEANDIADKISHNDFAKEMVDDQSHVPLLAGAEFAIKELAKRHDIVLLTARDKTWEAATKHWLKDKFGKDVMDVHFTSAHKDEHEMTKGQLCRHLDAEVLIDDNVEHCQSALDEGVQALLFGNYGWHHAAPDNIKRCRDWQAVLDFFSDDN